MGGMRFDKIGVDTWQRLGAAAGTAYAQGKQQDEVEKIINDKPVDSTSLSTEQNEQVFQALADGGTATDVKNDDGSFGGVAVSKPLPEGIEGPAQAQTFAPQKITRYLGQDFVGGLDPARATSLRNRALANIITKNDPLQGIKLDAMLKQSEREDQDYGDKQQARDLIKRFAAESDPFKRAEIGRKLSVLPGGGEAVKGFGDIEKANYRAVFNHANGFLARGDVAGAMNVYNQYDNGEDGEVVALPGGGYQLNFYQGKPGEGAKPTSSKTFKNLDAVQTWFNDQFDPDAALKRRTEAASNELKFGREVQKAILVEQAKAGAREGTLRPGYRWETDEDGNTVQVRIDGGAGTGSGGKKKAPATPEDAADGLFMEAIKQTSSNQNVFTPLQINAGSTAARTAMRLNPGIRPEVAATAGMAYAEAHSKPGSTFFSWDPNTNSAVEQVETPHGRVAVNPVTYMNAGARKMPPEQIKAAVAASLASVAGDNPERRQKVIAAAFDPTGKVRRELINDAKAELMAMPQFKELSPQAQAEALKVHEARVNQALTNPLGWIKNHGQYLQQK